MIKMLKRGLLGSFSILSLSTVIWIVLLTNPAISYANETQMGQITVFHNGQLEDGTETVVNNALSLIKNAEIYDENFKIQLCLNDDKIYPNLHPVPGGAAYAFLNKAVVFASKPNFKNNKAEFRWEINNNELRSYNLTQLLAHEFTHNLQYNYDPTYYIKTSLGTLNWKLEGHAEYVARGFKNDGALTEKIKFYLEEEKKAHQGIPVFTLEDGTIQNLSYFKYALVVQYLFEVKHLDYGELTKLNPNLDTHYSEMIEWSDESK